MTTVYLMKDSVGWYLTYIVTNRALEEFCDSCWYCPVMWYHDRKARIDIHPDRNDWVLKTAMDFAEYFNVTLEIA